MTPPPFIDLPGGVTTIDSGFKGDGMAACHLIVQDGRAAFIDVATSRATPRLLYTLEAKGVAREAVDWVIVTHVHLDHAGAPAR